MLKKTGKKKSNKLEIYKSSDWPGTIYNRKTYRLRVNGRWWPEDDPHPRYFYKSQIMALIAKSIHFHQ